jgi:alpha-beta hydrolase superfamily lysophospholipase
MDIVGARGELTLSMLGSGWLDRMAPSAPAPAGVLLLPGFLASGRSLLRLKQFLNRHGWLAESWGQGRNMGPRGKAWAQHLDALELKLSERIESLADQTSAPVSLIGQSLGGVYARDLARRFEPFVDRVITLGSPTFHPYRHARHNRVIGRVGEWMNRRSTSELAGRKGLLHLDADHPALPLVAIHSPLDGIVDERSCCIPDYLVADSGTKAPRENIRVVSTHIGMNASLWVWLAVADRLAQPRDDWQKFDPGQYLRGPLAPLSRLVYLQQSPTQRTTSVRRFIELSQR